MKTVLVADDEGALADAVGAVLVDEGYRVLLAHDGRQALQVIEESRPDVVVLDFMMPILSGAGVLSALDGRAGAPPVILMSAAAEGEALREARGHVAFLRKPFSADALVEAVAKALARS